MELLLERIDYGQKQTLGRLFALNEFKIVKYDCSTLELPWKENQQNISCIPEGEYQVEKRFSRKFKSHFHITGVDGRSYILIHAGNYYTDIRGCVLVGKDFKDLNKDGLLDVKDSGDALADLLGLMPKKSKLKIVKV